MKYATSILGKVAHLLPEVWMASLLNIQMFPELAKAQVQLVSLFIA